MNNSRGGVLTLPSKLSNVIFNKEIYKHFSQLNGTSSSTPRPVKLFKAPFSRPQNHS